MTTATLFLYGCGDYSVMQSPTDPQGTCLGFQTLCVLTAGPSILTCDYNSEDLPLPLTFTTLANSSIFFQGFPGDLIAAIQTRLLSGINNIIG